MNFVFTERQIKTPCTITTTSEKFRLQAILTQSQKLGLHTTNNYKTCTSPQLFNQISTLLQ